MKCHNLHVRNVVADGASKELRVLRNQTTMPVHASQVQRGEIFAVKRDSALLWIVESHHQVNQRAFTAT